ncbi:M24 family metallopeptidase [Salegentibacter salegens]|uniref:Metallopeptidase family M24 n=1 Tax=Salegentibacter salegens TaxID=143223 RepID=A0A1M7NIG9_9FLAO|nr:M24 family metallopeptidase [Salegentibacter salegens]PRX43353.1 metallopeptidase family M24 [Salegentibacter salegens]SHN03685.1 Metallopeptidase family M24 [Salegentibacter salegens]
MYQLFLLIGLLSVLNTSAQILPERERARLVNEILSDKFENLLPGLMDNAAIDMWIVISREYNEDPVLRTMLPATWLNARRRTILVFHRNKEIDSLERLAVARYEVGESIEAAWDPEKQPEQWKALIDIIETRDPQRIALNFSKNYGLADGLVKTDSEEFLDYLPGTYKNRLVSGEELAVGWIETRTQMEMELYPQLVEITKNIIREAFSEKVIIPGETTTEDVVWWMRQKVTELGLETWFHPSVSIQRDEEALEDHILAFSSNKEGKVIYRGDLVHCDFGITYLRLNTDCQQMAYVLKQGETEAPQFLEKAFEKANQLQDILTGNFETGKSGNQILSESLNQAREEGLKPMIYTHPLGLYGHSAGTTIGMWDSQEGVPGSGKYPLNENTVYAIELNTSVFLEEWNQEIRIMLEEAGFWGAEGFLYVNGRQEELILIPSK